jgi:high-affinity iron transporter
MEHLAAATQAVRQPWLRPLLLGLAAVVVLAALVWQAVTQNGTPDPTTGNLSPLAVLVDSGILVFREGLEAILVLAAITASLTRDRRISWRPIGAGVAAGLAATVLTWFGVVSIIAAVNAPELAVQAATGLLAIVVLLVIMNWFFHKIYWTGWIAHHNRRRRALADTAEEHSQRAQLGLVLLGFTAIYREGFEVVLFLQNLRLQAGAGVVLNGTLIGLALTAIVALLTFAAHERLPYKKMLVLTGVLLGFVLVVMVGESVQEMQQAGWLATTALNLPIPDWMGVWLAVSPNLQGLVAQALAALVVLGSYVGAEWLRVWRPQRQRRQAASSSA